MTHCHQTTGSLGPQSTSIKGCWEKLVRISIFNLSCFQERAHDNIVRISISKVQGRTSKPLLCVIYECNDCRNGVKALCTAGNHKHCPQELLLFICIHDTLFLHHQHDDDIYYHIIIAIIVIVIIIIKLFIVSFVTIIIINVIIIIIKLIVRFDKILMWP